MHGATRDAGAACGTMGRHAQNRPRTAGRLGEPWMTALQHLLDTFRATAHTEREKGAYFERLVKA